MSVGEIGSGCLEEPTTQKSFPRGSVYVCRAKLGSLGTVSSIRGELHSLVNEQPPRNTFGFVLMNQVPSSLLFVEASTGVHIKVFVWGGEK